MRIRRLAIAAFAIATCAAAHGQLKATVVHTGLSNPVHYVQDPLFRNTQYIVEQGGLIKIRVGGVIQATPFLSMVGQISTGGERGLLDMEFPRNVRSGTFYITFTDPSGHTRVARFDKSFFGAHTANANSRRNIIKLDQPFSNHNSATIRFGPDNLLYIGTGDGGSSNDPGNRAQDPNQLLGKVLRIDPSATQFGSDPDRHYTIPPNNPFLGGQPITALPEIWAFGMRNPYKMSFDLGQGGTRGLFIADVGQSAREEINFEPVGQGGRNYGWRVKEGTLFTGLSGTAYLPFTDPIIDLDRTLSRSITGGVVYRGSQLPAQYYGRYFFGDYVNRRVWSLGLSYHPTTGEATVIDMWEHTAELGGNTAVGNVTAVESDSTGELFVVNHGGTIFRIDAQ